MNILFIGSGVFGLPTLQQLAIHHDVVGIITSIDRPAGRNRSVTQTPIAQWGVDQDIAVWKTEDVNTQEMVQTVDSLDVGVMVVIAFGQKLSEQVIGTRLAINLHASLLPKWRGASPINAAILHGDNESGVSVIALAQHMDAGSILGQLSTQIGETETAGELHDRLAMLGPPLVLASLEEEGAGVEQDESFATYAPKLSRNDAMLDLSCSAERVSRTIRGLSPWPGCHVEISGVDCKLLRAIPNKSSGEVGTILEDETVAVGAGSIEILELQPAGSKPMSWKEFCNGRNVQVGDVVKVQS